MTRGQPAASRTTVATEAADVAVGVAGEGTFSSLYLLDMDMMAPVGEGMLGLSTLIS